MQINIGFELVYTCSRPTPMNLMLNVHHSYARYLVEPDHISTSPSIAVKRESDLMGNWCSRIIAPAGDIKISADAVINHAGTPDEENPSASQAQVEALPKDALFFLLGSRYCETDLLMETAWSLFSNTPPGWARVQAICDYVHDHTKFGYQYSWGSKTAWDTFNDKSGVCRDFTHLAITFCRCMNIPARYCTGYLPDIGVPYNHEPMDFVTWLEAYLDGHWYVFDPRNNQRRIGRVLIARGRDAVDVAISNSFGQNELTSFRVIADEVPVERRVASRRTLEIVNC